MSERVHHKATDRMKKKHARRMKFIVWQGWRKFVRLMVVERALEMTAAAEEAQRNAESGRESTRNSLREAFAERLLVVWQSGTRKGCGMRRSKRGTTRGVSFTGVICLLLVMQRKGICMGLF